MKHQKLKLYPRISSIYENFKRAKKLSEPLFEIAENVFYILGSVLHPHDPELTIQNCAVTKSKNLIRQIQFARRRVDNEV